MGAERSASVSSDHSPLAASMPWRTDAGVPADTLEADEGGWHVWAYAACDGGMQYRIFFTAATPAAPDHLEAQRTLVASARIGGEA